MKTLNLEQLKENLENELTTYDDFVKLANKAYDNDLLDIEQFFELMNDNIAEEIITDDFKVVDKYIDTIRTNIEEEFNLDGMNALRNDYTYQPNEDGGIFTESNIMYPDMGFIGQHLNTTTVIEIRIDFRPECGTYLMLHVINNNINCGEKGRNVLGDEMYLHYDVSLDGSLSDSSLESY